MKKKKRIWQKVFWIEPLMSILIFWEMRHCNYTSSEKKKVQRFFYNFSLITVFLLKRKLSHVFYFMFFYSLRRKSFFSFIFISWRLITLQYCSGFCHTLTWISHGFTCVPHPDPPSRLPLYLIPLGLPSAPGPSTCFMHPTWAGDLFHPR